MDRMSMARQPLVRLWVIPWSTGPSNVTCTATKTAACVFGGGRGGGGGGGRNFLAARVTCVARSGLTQARTRSVGAAASPSRIPSCGWAA
jgi:hypothetical protein